MINKGNFMQWFESKCVRLGENNSQSAKQTDMEVFPY